MSMNYVITKNVPLPENKAGRGGKKYPFRDMAVGDSFAVAPADFDQAKAAAHSFARRHGVSFITNRDQLRIWRKN
jgi:hypothetical protein